MAFELFKIEDIRKAVTSIIKKHKTIASATQEILMGMAYELESNQDTTELTRFIVELSDVEDDKVLLSATARAVGVYMQDNLPVKWSRKSQSFEVTDEVFDFDFTTAAVAMGLTRWDKHNVKSADAEFDADKTLLKAISMIRGVVKHHDDGDLQDDDPAYIKARTILKAVA